MPDAGRSVLQVAELSAPEGWEAFLVATPPPPAEDEQAAILRALVSGLRKIAEQGWELHAEVFLQIWKIAVEGTAALYEANITRWNPSVGIGVRPGSPPPQRTTQDVAMDHAASIMLKEEPVLAAYHLCRVSAGMEAALHAEGTLLGRGMILEMYARDSFTAVQQAGRQVFLPGIADVAYRGFPFYLPLLDAVTISNAMPEQMERWMCGAELYLRESVEDRALLILSKRPLREIMNRAVQMMDEAYAKRPQSPELTRQV